MSDRLSDLLDQSVPPVSDFDPLRAEFERFVPETERAARRRVKFRRRAAVFISIGALAFGGATAAAAAPLIHRAIYHPTPAYPLSGKPVDVTVSYRWSSQVDGPRVACVSSSDFVLSKLAEARLIDAREVIAAFYATLDVPAIQKSAHYRSILKHQHVGEDPARAELDRQTERFTLTEIITDRLTLVLEAHKLGLMALYATGDYHCSDGK